MQTLSQLSYSPVSEREYIAADAPTTTVGNVAVVRATLGGGPCGTIRA